ncbi:MAG: endonuclease domain-containing protein, partial [Syntrophales bacterium]|nr:endonuclease domain-containing protein [Syntrophales bacterium]
ILSFVVDFFCPKAGLVIEVDGGQHFEPVQEEKDKDRDRKLRALGLRVLRFDNRKVLQETVMEVIWRETEDY